MRDPSLLAKTPSSLMMFSVLRSLISCCLRGLWAPSAGLSHRAPLVDSEAATATAAHRSEPNYGLSPVSRV